MTKINDIKEEQAKVRDEIMKVQDKANGLLQKFNELKEKEFELDDNFIKIVCPNCNGTGMVKKEDHREKCPACGSKNFVWAEIYK